MTTLQPGVWNDAIRQWDHRVYLSVLALGLPPDRAREIVQTAWTTLMEKRAAGTLREIELPGLAIPDYVRSTVGATVGRVPCSSAFETFLASASLDYRFDGHIARVGSRHELAEYDIEAVAHADVLARLGKKLEPLPAGPTMNLDFHGVPLPTVLQLIAKAGNVKLVVPDYVKGGTVTIIGNDVPWDAALRAVLASHGLDFRYTESGRLVRIGTRHELMDEEREQLER